MTPTPGNPSPAELARAALRRLAELRLPPTPELFAQHYYAIAGTRGAPPATQPAAPPIDPQLLERVGGIVGKAAEVTQALADDVSRGSDEVGSSLEGLVAEEMPANAVELLQAVVATANAMHATLRASHEELLDARRSLAVIEAELVESRKLLHKDALTGSENRRAMSEILSREMARARRENEPMSVAMVDVDHFKKVNEDYGHAGGDAALVHLTQLARQVLRGNDAFIRYGGEEFLLVLGETASAGAVFVCKRLQQALQKTPCAYQGRDIALTFSAGVATLTYDDTEATLLKRADVALYEAKKGGRNLVLASA